MSDPLESPRHLWILAALVPTLAHLSLEASLAWAGALLLGGSLAAGLTASQRARWVGVGWLAAVLVPGVQPAAVASSGLAAPRASLLAAAILGVLLTWLPPEHRSPGVLLLAAGVAACALEGLAPKRATAAPQEQAS